jgi:hypothetical protein
MIQLFRGSSDAQKHSEDFADFYCGWYSAERVGVCCSAAYPRHIGLVCLIVLGSAMLLELAQLLTPDRHGRIQDAIIKMTGGAIGIVAGRAILYAQQASRWFQN